MIRSLVSRPKCLDQILVLPPPCCVAQSTSFNLSEPPLPLPQYWNHNGFSFIVLMSIKWFFICCVSRQCQTCGKPSVDLVVMSCITSRLFPPASPPTWCLTIQQVSCFLGDPRARASYAAIFLMSFLIPRFLSHFHFRLLFLLFFLFSFFLIPSSLISVTWPQVLFNLTMLCKDTQIL